MYSITDIQNELASVDINVSTESIEEIASLHIKDLSNISGKVKNIVVQHFLETATTSSSLAINTPPTVPYNAISGTLSTSLTTESNPDSGKLARSIPNRLAETDKDTSYSSDIAVLLHGSKEDSLKAVQLLLNSYHSERDNLDPEIIRVIEDSKNVEEMGRNLARLEVFTVVNSYYETHATLRPYVEKHLEDSRNELLARIKASTEANAKKSEEMQHSRKEELKAFFASLPL